MAPIKRINLFTDWILAKVYNEDKEIETGATAGGIVLPQSVIDEKKKDRADKAIVLDVGPEVKNVVIGKKIAFLRFAPLEIEFDKDKFILLRAIDVIGVIP